MRSTRALPAGAAALRVEEVRGRGPGPRVTLIGGVHGDEPEGALAVARVLRELDPSRLRGTMRALPIANPLAWAAGSRTTPADGGNLARAFPGGRDGTATERIARAITDELISGADLVVDLHSAGRAYAMPFFCGYCADDTDDTDDCVRARAAAEAFAAPILWRHDPPRPGRTLSAARELGVPAIYAEASGGSEVRGDQLDGMVSGTFRALAAAGAYEAASSAAPAAPLVLAGGDGDVDRSLATSAAGLLVTRVRAGDPASPGDVLAEVYGEGGELLETLPAPVGGVIMMLRRDARVVEGTPVAMIGPPAEET